MYPKKTCSNCPKIRSKRRHEESSGAFIDDKINNYGFSSYEWNCKGGTGGGGGETMDSFSLVLANSFAE